MHWGGILYDQLNVPNGAGGIKLNIGDIVNFNGEKFIILWIYENGFCTANRLTTSKTKVTHIENGFDFLGFNIRKYKTHNGSKVLIKPSKNSIKVAKKKITDKTRQFYGKNVQILVSTLNPIIIGTANS